MKAFFRNIVLLLNLIAGAALLIVYASVYISPAKYWIPAIIGLAYPYILFINILFIFYWLLGTRKYALISTLFIVIGYTHLLNYFSFRNKHTDEAGIKIVSYNIKRFEGHPEVPKAENAKAILDLIRDKKPDIVCIQEMNFMSRRGFEGFKKEFSLKGFPRYTHHVKSGGTITFSNYPIIGRQEIHFKESGNMFIYTDVVAGSDTVRIFNCHLQSYRFSPKDISTLDSLTLEDQERNLKGARLFGSKLKRGFIQRAEQSERLRDEIDQSPYPVIICGDFNDTPVSYTYARVRGKLKDAFVESGTGIGNTYLGRLPSFRIDYILHSNLFDGYNFTIDKVNYSDHYAVSCILVRKEW